MSEYSVFKPKSTRGMFVDYPELRKLKAFASLKEADMLFVWFYACESSPVNNKKRDINQREKVQEAIDYSYKADNKNLISKIEIDSMLEGRFRDSISAAIEQMEKFRVGPRIRAKQMTENMFANIEHIINIDASDKTQFLTKDDEVDFGKKKAYVDTVEKSLKLMPQLIESLEGGYRLTEEEKDDVDLSDDGESIIDAFHDNEE